MLFDHQNNLIKMIKLILLESTISRNMLLEASKRGDQNDHLESERYIARNMLFDFSVPRLSRYGASQESPISKNMLFDRVRPGL
jgi:hypothetical protein